MNFIFYIFCSLVLEGLLIVCLNLLDLVLYNFSQVLCPQVALAPQFYHLKMKIIVTFTLSLGRNERM